MRQCAKCPWRVDTDPHDIPNGYDVELHASLESTISEGAASLVGDLVHMACHETKNGDEKPCVGWLSNQLGLGNNIALRMAVYTGQIDPPGELRGAQHECFEDTLP